MDFSKTYFKKYCFIFFYWFKPHDDIGVLQISSRFLADLKALADFPLKMKEFERGSKEK